MAKPLFKNKIKSYDPIDDDDFDYDSISLDDILYPDKKDKKDKETETKRKTYDESEDNELAVLDSIINGNYKKKQKERKKKLKQEKKKKKKKDKKSKNKVSEKEKKLIDLQQIYGLDDKRINRAKLDRDDEEFYESRFNGSLYLIRETLKQVNKQIVNGESIQEELRNNPRLRGALTALTAQTANITSLLGTKLQIIKEISNINKIVSDLELKKAKEKGDANSGSTVNEDFVISEIFSKVVNGEVDINDVKTGKIDKDDEKKDKKKKKKKDKKSKNKDKDDEDIDMYEVINDHKSTEPVYGEDEEDYDDEDDDFDDYDFDASEYDDIDDALDARIKEMEDDDELEFSDTERAYKYEGKVKIVVLKNPKTERWRFVALDQDGDEIEDYPLPEKKACGTMSFDREKGLAKDKLNNVYTLMYENDLGF